MIDQRIFSFLFLILTVMFIVLSWIVDKRRCAAKVFIAGGSDQPLQRAIAAQANFFQYSTFALIGFFIIAMQNINSIFYGILVGLFIIARLFHAYSILIAEPQRQSYRWRQLGMVLTFLILVTSALIIFVNLNF